MENTLNRRCALLLCGILFLGSSACPRRQDGGQNRKVEALQADLLRVREHESALKGEVSHLTQQVTRLQNDFRLYSQRPCEYELDPLDYTIRKVERRLEPRPADGPGAAKPARPTRPDASASGPDDVNRRIRQARHRIRTCYLEAAKKNATLQTLDKRVQLVFDLQPSGQLTGVMITPPVGFGFETCVRSLLSAWRFSQFQGQPQRFRAWMNLRPQ